MRTYSPGLNPHPPCTHLHASVMTPSLTLPEYVLYEWPLS